MLTFDELWGASQPFRQLFLYNNIFKSTKNLKDDDLGRAEVYWSERRPRYDWHPCPMEGCQELVVKEEYCTKHYLEMGTLPSRKWFRGYLYRRLMVEIRNDRHYDTRDPQYRKNHLHQAELVYGEIPQGYTVHFIDGNPFNHLKRNLLVLSRIAATILETEKLSLPDAMELDEILRDFVQKKCGVGRPKHRWVYGYEDIAKAIGRHPPYVGNAIARERFDPSDLCSVIDFCKTVEKTA